MRARSSAVGVRLGRTDSERNNERPVLGTSKAARTVWWWVPSTPWHVVGGREC